MIGIDLRAARLKSKLLMDGRQDLNLLPNIIGSLAKLPWEKNIVVV